MRLKTTFKTNLVAIGFGLFLIIFIFIFGELSARVYYKLFPVEQADTFSDVPYMIGDEALGYRLRPSTKARVVKRIQAEIIYDVIYSSDEVGRRKTTFQKKRKKFALFFGDSNTFGEGIDEHETLPYFFAKTMKEYTPYNYAFQGYGTQQMLEWLKQKSFRENVSQKNGVAFYSYFDYHINRVIGATEYLKWNPGIHPYYYLDQNHQLKRDGNFINGRAVLTKFYHLFNFSALFRALGLNLPLFINNSHRELLCEVIKESRKSFLENFPDSKFVVLINPVSGKNDKMIESCFVKEHFTFIDLRDLCGNQNYFDLRDKGIYAVRGDGHFNGKTNELMVQKMLPELKSLGI